MCIVTTKVLTASRNAVTTGGFTYIGLLIVIAVMGIGLGAIGPLSRSVQLRDKEAELLFIGDEFRRAITRYYEESPGGIKQYPKKLADLLRDNRQPGIQRHLRKIYVDPLTGKNEWGLVEVRGYGITGVYSLYDKQPIKKANFPKTYKSFEGATTYADWKFVYSLSDALSQSENAGSGRGPSLLQKR